MKVIRDQTFIDAVKDMCLVCVSGFQQAEIGGQPDIARHLSDCT